jgi:hypothetical protein
MLDPTSHWQSINMIRKVTYGARRRPSTDNRWWLQEGDGADAFAPQAVSEAEQRAQIEAEPAFRSSALMGFGDPGKMLEELVLPADVSRSARALPCLLGTIPFDTLSRERWIAPLTAARPRRCTRPRLADAAV